jgi:hypothetical protein
MPDYKSLLKEAAELDATTLTKSKDKYRQRFYHRNKVMFGMREDGLTYKEIGLIVGLHPERARVAIIRWGETFGYKLLSDFNDIYKLKIKTADYELIKDKNLTLKQVESMFLDSERLYGRTDYHNIKK